MTDIETSLRYAIIAGIIVGLIFGLLWGYFIFPDKDCTIITTNPPAKIVVQSDCAPCVCEGKVIKETDLAGCLEMVKTAKHFEKQVRELR